MGKKVKLTKTGILQMIKKDYKEAIKTFDQLIDIEPYSRNYGFRGEAKLKCNDLEGAMEDFNKSIDIEPEHSPNYYLRGMTKAQSDDFKGGLTDLNETPTIRFAHSAASCGVSSFVNS